MILPLIALALASPADLTWSSGGWHIVIGETLVTTQDMPDCHYRVLSKIKAGLDSQMMMTDEPREQEGAYALARKAKMIGADAVLNAKIKRFPITLLFARPVIATGLAVKFDDRSCGHID